jgi:hypothetical protein
VMACHSLPMEGLGQTDHEVSGTWASGCGDHLLFLSDDDDRVHGPASPNLIPHGELAGVICHSLVSKVNGVQASYAR